MHTHDKSDAVRNFKLPSQVRWLYMYFALGALGIAAISARLSFSQAITGDFSKAVTSNYEWVEREGLYSELIRLANACEVPVVKALDSNVTDTAAADLSESVRDFHKHLRIARKEAHLNVNQAERLPMLEELNKVSELLRVVESEGRQAIEDQSNGDSQSAIGHLAALNSSSEHAAQLMSGIFRTIRSSFGNRFEEQLREAETMRGYQVWFAFGVLGLVAGVSFYGHRLSNATHQSMQTMSEQAIALANNEARLRTILATAAEGIVTINAHGVIDSCNAATLELFRCDENEVVGRTLRSMVSHSAGPSQSATATSINGSNPVSLDELVGQRQELVAERPDGTNFVVDFAAAEVKIDEQRTITGILHDITDRKLFEAKLDQARHAAEAATRAKSQSLANMSHEIRTPMTAILGFADLLREPGHSEEERVRCTETIRRNADYLLSLLNDILDLSKIEAGGMSVEQIKCQPIQLVQDVVALKRQAAYEKGIELDVVFDSSVPATIEGDPVRIRQILLNLISNSIKFTNEGYVRLHVAVHDVKTNPNLHFKIVDTGIGMTEPQTARLFRPFTQADSSTTREFGGTGLGLSICKRLVEMMGGMINVTSVVDLGSTFTFYVPTGSLAEVQWIESFSLAAQNANETPTPCQTSQLPARVLLAEDGVDNRRLISYHLQKAGATVVHTENGQEAVQQARLADQLKQPFDIILMDMQMPILDGYQATGELRQLGYRGPIVALTAHALFGDREKCINAGCDDYLNKPINAKKLLETVRRFWHQTQMADGELSSVEAATLVVDASRVSSTRSAASMPKLESNVTSNVKSLERSNVDGISNTTSRADEVSSDEVRNGDCPEGGLKEASSKPQVSPNIVDSMQPEPLLSEFAGDEEMLEMLETFVNSLVDRIELIDKLFTNQEWTKLKDMGHQLKGAAGGYGFPAITELAAQVERLSQQAADSELDNENDSINQLKSCVDGLIYTCRRAILGGTIDATDEQSPHELAEVAVVPDLSVRENTFDDSNVVAILDEIEVLTSTIDDGVNVTDKLGEVDTPRRHTIATDPHKEEDSEVVL